MQVDVAEHAVDEGYEWSKDVENGGEKSLQHPVFPGGHPSKY
jgi:hypothetical protein